MLPANTLILVNPYGVRKPIQDIHINDQVVTHMREQKKVTGILTGNMTAGSLINIEIVGYTQHIQLTEKQMMLTYPNLTLLEGKPETEIVGSIADRSFDIAWKYAKDLTTEDYIQIPTPYIHNSVQRSKIEGGDLPGSNQGLYAKIGHIQTRPYRGKMYSLIVADENSFIARGYPVRT
jgi:hypothetical protein